MKTKNIKCICKECKKEFFVKDYEFERGRGIYCSKICFDTNQDKKINLICSGCGKNFKRSKSNVEQNANGLYYCSLECWYSRNKNTTICLWCGKIIEPMPKSHINRGQGKFCSYECSGKYRSNLNSITVKCSNCGKEIKRKKSRKSKSNEYFCSTDCLSQYRKGINHHCWINGSSFGNYCEKFNREFKERVREFWGRKCGLCEIEENNCSRKLHVHHIFYNKDACCNEESPKYFIPLCASCHSKTNIWNREHWQELFMNIVMNKNNGKTYFTKEEMYGKSI